MKKLLADYLNIKEEEIESYQFNTAFDLETKEHHHYIQGNIYEPQYEVRTKLEQKYYWINLEELLVFIYNKK